MVTRQILTYGIAVLVMFVGMQTAKAQYYIPSDTSIGTWDATNRIYTLTQDVYAAAIIIDEDNLTFDGDGHTLFDGGSVVIFERAGITTKNINIESTSYGIWVRDSSYCKMTDNTFKNNRVGIGIVFSDNCSIAGNTFPNEIYSDLETYSGIIISMSNNCSVINNTILDAGFDGISLRESNDSIVKSNTITCYDMRIGGTIGITCSGENSIMTDNNVSGFVFGIGCDASNSILINNTVSYNWCGMLTNEAVYNNNFINNTYEIYGTHSFNLPAPFGGNYYNKHTGPDTNNDGFVDTPYEIYWYDGTKVGQDNLPWTVRDGWRKPEVRIAQLVNKVVSLNLQQGISNSLDAKLDAVKKALADVNQNNDGAAVGALGAFINAVEAQRGSKIPEADADYLIESARQIIDLLNNG